VPAELDPKDLVIEPEDSIDFLPEIVYFDDVKFCF
jgi:hypothetical protein